MYAHLGFYLLFLCCLISGYGVFASAGAALLRHRRLYRSSRLAATSVFFLALFAAALLLYMFYQRDYSVAYIFKNSSNDLPAIYTLTAFWSSLEGSHFLWTLFMSLFCVIAHWTTHKDNEHIMPYVSLSLQAILCWMFFLAITKSDPFLQMLPAPSNGQGMNTLLQNPYMAIHPPTLFIGYTALAIPFAYSAAALFFGDITEGWLRTVRRWTLFAFCALTAGIILGGRWAYMELGWAGYWAWDPVENSSFIPWLFCTALMHSLLVQERLGQLKRLTLLLAFFGFFFSFFGTFITRSGVISSVHSFAESDIGTYYLIFLSSLFASFIGLYALRAPSVLPADTGKAWGVSKESALVITQFLLITFAAIVCIGTLFPIVSEALTGQRVSIQAPYYNAFAPWLGLGFIIAIAVGNLMRFQSDKIVGGSKVFLKAAIFAVPFALLFGYLGEVHKTTKMFNLGAQAVGIYLCFWCIGCLSYSAYERLKDLRFEWRLYFKKNLAFTGAYIAHVGFIIGILGFLGNYRGTQSTVTMKVGDTHKFGHFEFVLDKIHVKEEHNATIFAANFTAIKDGKERGNIEVGRAKYPTKPELMHEVGIRSFFWQDLYVVMSDFDKTSFNSGTFEIYINPTVRVVWIATFIVVLGGLLAMFDQLRGMRSMDAIMARWKLS
ncbi:MAG: heme lyase CcmF/NrfE family subunit [Oligoflexales bacterium]|nr:heme lyase CcmF/NrfE family subunit [Oligoflexales bacterium]